MLHQILFAPITGLTWIAEQVHDRVMVELDQKENLHKRLLALQMAFDMGELDEETFEIQEEELLLAIQAMEEAE
ncbi:gas vesicle protein GvpG [Alkalinema pantanalense CENA528]|uniref:gas vesicle protein GvpG n=1 Tax=Alkalinema TaxID=1620700 RepID=UPI001683EC19|nr:gas vesicle protein GvpG [Alkalinema sp. FACHB-956]MBD2329409.1 gas vesicle protein GvpG [Alkalinema sp. FACHB-956]